MFTASFNLDPILKLTVLLAGMSIVLPVRAECSFTKILAKPGRTIEYASKSTRQLITAFNVVSQSDLDNFEVVLIASINSFLFICISLVVKKLYR